MTRTIAAKVKSQLEYIDEGAGKWTQKTFSTFKNFQITFTLGEKFVEETADGRKCDVSILIKIENEEFCLAIFIVHRQL